MPELPVSFLNAHIALGFGDPGGINPITLQEPNPVTDRWYDMIPEMYRIADDDDTSTSLGWPLYGYMDAACSTLVEPTFIANRIAAGQLTDPALADDEWIPWLAQAIGVYGTGVAEQRARLANVVSQSALGSLGYMTVMVQEFLTGTKYAVVTPAPPWGIEIRVRVDELSLVGDTVGGLAAALYATGRVPAGFLLTIVTDQETWAQLAVAMPTWAPGQGQQWKRIDSMGLTGSGFTAGAVRWTGTVVGTAP